MKYLKVVLILVIVSILVLFAIQNSLRTPSIDATGAYLSLDLGVVGVVQKEPISLLWYFLAFFLLGMVTSKLLSLRSK